MKHTCPLCSTKKIEHEMRMSLEYGCYPTGPKQDGCENCPWCVYYSRPIERLLEPQEQAYLHLKRWKLGA